MQEKQPEIVIGRLGGAYGVRGWMKVSSYTRPKENIFSYSPWLLRIGERWQQVSVDDKQQRGDRLTVKLSGVESPEQARELLHSDIAIFREQLPPLAAGEYYWFDLVGLQVFNQDDVRLGEVSNIVETGANDLLVVKDANKRRDLIPLVNYGYVMQVDLNAGTMQVDWYID